jgi:hypothetical protein
VKRSISRSAVLAAVLALAVAGCGGSSKKSTSSHALSKAQYSHTVSRVLGAGVIPAFMATGLLTFQGQVVGASGGTRDPQKLQTAARGLQKAQHALASLTPPPGVADLNRRAVTVIGALAADFSKMRAALLAKQQAAYVTAAKTYVKDALKMLDIRNELTLRGY